jgi:hypothetical protein
VHDESSFAARSGVVLEAMLRWLPYSALAVVAAFALRRLDDFDTWWHLASGRWIAQHHAVPYTDVLSFTVRNNEWINLQWLYDLLLYAIYSLSGASGLVIASAACFVATFAILARHLARFLGPVASTALLIWVAATVNERFLIRPEMASFPLLAAVQLVLADGRHNPKRLRWLVPLMILWANMHSLFIVGLAAIAAAIGGALLAETQAFQRVGARTALGPRRRAANCDLGRSGDRRHTRQSLPAARLALSHRADEKDRRIERGLPRHRRVSPAVFRLLPHLRAQLLSGHDLHARRPRGARGVAERERAA